MNHLILISLQKFPCTKWNPISTVCWGVIITSQWNMRNWSALHCTTKELFGTTHALVRTVHDSSAQWWASRLRMYAQSTKQSKIWTNIDHSFCTQSQWQNPEVWWFQYWPLRTVIFFQTRQNTQFYLHCKSTLYHISHYPFLSMDSLATNYKHRKRIRL